MQEPLVKFPVTPPSSVQGIYLTAGTIAGSSVDKILDSFKNAGGNMIVFDTQSGGRLAYPSQIPLSREIGNFSDLIPDLPGMVQKLHDKGFYVVARYVLFKNGFLAAKKPAFTLKAKKTSRPFVNRDGPIWIDPSDPYVITYFSDIMREIADAGVDEIQFDYVRFPEAGKGGYIGYSFAEDKNLTRDQAITRFVKNLAGTLHERGVKVSVDVFGIVVWEEISWKLIGQNIRELAKYVDAIYPMPYPSHFGPGWGGHKNPGDEPYFFVHETTKKFLEQTNQTTVEIRPWLQGFAMRTSRFGPSYIKEQIRALHDLGVYGFSVWNASNNYWATFQALGK